MDQLPWELRNKIFQNSSLLDRFVNFRLVNCDWYNAVDFGDLRSIQLSYFERSSNRELTDDAWVANFLASGLPIIGESLESFGFIPVRKERSRFDSIERPFDRYVNRKWTMSPPMLRSLVDSCPNLREINFIGVHVKPNAYRILEQLASTLTTLTMPDVVSADALGRTLEKLRLRKLALGGRDVSELNTADNSLLQSITLVDDNRRGLLRRYLPDDADLDLGVEYQLPPALGIVGGHVIFPPGIQMIGFNHQPQQNELAMLAAANRRRLDDFVARFPNLRTHGGFDDFLIFDKETNRLTPITVSYSRLRDLRRSAVLDDSDHCNLCVPLLARHFPRLERLALSGTTPAHLETIALYPRLRHLILNVDELSRSQLKAFLSLENLRKLEIGNWKSPPRFIDDNGGEVEVRCVLLKLFRCAGFVLPRNIVASVLNACPRLEIIDIPKFDFSSQLAAYRQLTNLSTVSVTSDNVWQFFAENFPRLRQLSMNLDLDIYRKPTQRLFAGRQLRDLRFVGPLFEFLILEAIVNASPRLEKLVAGEFAGCGHPQMLFYSIGRHSHLRQVQLLCVGSKPFANQQLASILESLYDGRMILCRSGFNIRWLRIDFEPPGVIDGEIFEEQRQKLAKLRVVI